MEDEVMVGLHRWGYCKTRECRKYYQKFEIGSRGGTSSYCKTCVNERRKMRMARCILVINSDRGGSRRRLGISIPIEVLDKLGWKYKTKIKIELHEDYFIVRKRD